MLIAKHSINDGQRSYAPGEELPAMSAAEKARLLDLGAADELAAAVKHLPAAVVKKLKALIENIKDLSAAAAAQFTAAQGALMAASEAEGDAIQAQHYATARGAVDNIQAANAQAAAILAEVCELAPESEQAGAAAVMVKAAADVAAQAAALIIPAPVAEQANEPAPVADMTDEAAAANQDGPTA